MAGLSVHAYMHTPSTVDFTMERKTTAITRADILLLFLHDSAKMLMHSLLVAIDSLFIRRHKRSSVSSRMVSIV